MKSPKLTRLAAMLVPVLALSISPAATPAPAEPAKGAGGPSQVARGKYLAFAAGCSSCHSAPGGAPYAGGYPLNSPFGTIYGPNLTSDAETGIGSWTRADFERALRQGIRKDGSYLYPAMPYGSYTKISDADIGALWAYFHSLPPVKNQIPKNTLPFPLSVRTGIRLWQGLYFTPGRFTPVSGKSPQWNRGAYLVQALGHCDECHTPRNEAQGLELRHQMTGAQIDGWYAPNISDDPSSKVRRWSNQEFAIFLKSGALPDNSKAVGPMQEVIENGLRFLTAADIGDMVTYLKDQPTDASPQRPTAVKFARLAAGKRVYEDNCSSCHQSDGKGRSASIPALAANDAVTAPEPYNVIMAILEGFPPQGTWGAMGSFAANLSDDQIADVTNYVRTAWNNGGLPNATPWAVGSWRKNAQAADEGHALLCPNIDARVESPALALGAPALKQAAVDKAKMSQLVATYRADMPSASRADVVEALSTAYCRAIAGDHVSDSRMSTQLADYAQRIATALSGGAPHG